MPEAFQRLFERAEPVPAVLSLNVQAAMGPVHEPERTQFSLLTRHFLERFFNQETASPDRDGKTRLVQLACAAGMPGFMVAVYLWPVYHPFPGWPPRSTAVGPPPYWMQLNHHFFFVMFSFVAMGLITVFEWDLFFPDLLDVLVLGTLPLVENQVFLARVAAIGTLVAGFLFDANILPVMVLPMSTDPLNLPRFLSGHIVATAGSGLFAAAAVIALEGVLLASLGERLFRKAFLVLQGLCVTFFVVLLLLFPVLSGLTPALLQSGSSVTLWFPPFWFLGIYQRLLDGPAALPVFHQLTRMGCFAMAAVGLIALGSYPIAYIRRVRQLLEGPPIRSKRSWASVPLRCVLHATFVRSPIQRAVFHFVGQTILRVLRYRIYLVLYGGAGLSVVIAIILRFTIVDQHLRASVSTDGIRTATGVIAFWVIAGLRTAFVSSGNERGSWVLRLIHGKPAQFDAALEHLAAAKVWALLSGATVTITMIVALRFVEPAELTTSQSTVSQLLVAIGMCLLLTDVLFSNVMVIPFTGEAQREQPNLAFTVLRYFTFFPIMMSASIASELWVERSWLHFGIIAIGIVVAHLWLRKRHRDSVLVYSSLPEFEDGEDDFPMKLGLRY
jgi:hypothetical protein